MRRLGHPSCGRRRAGRPPLPAGRRRRYSVYLRLNEAEISTLEHRAEIAGVCPARLARDLALHATMPPPLVRRISPAAVGQLARIGHLLNQAVHRVHAGGLAPEFRDILEETYGFLSGLLHGLEAEPE
jgi:hypothetical protein